MASAAGKPPKKEKTKAQSPEKRLEAIRYNQMMYGPTAGEFGSVTKKTNFGATYLKHAKFQDLMTAFKTGLNSKFSVTDKDKSYEISTDGTQIYFDNKVLFYTRTLNRYESNLLLDKTVILRYQTVEAFVHLVFAVIRSLPELGPPRLSFKNNEFFWGSDELGAGILEQGPNLLIGSYNLQLSKTK